MISFFECFRLSGRLRPRRTQLQKPRTDLRLGENCSRDSPLSDLFTLSHLESNEGLVHACFKIFLFFPRFSWETSTLENYYFWEASKYNLLSKCSTHGYYILTKMCIVKPPSSSSSSSSSSSVCCLKSLQENLDFFFVIEIRYCVGPEEYSMPTS